MVFNLGQTESLEGVYVAPAFTSFLAWRPCVGEEENGPIDHCIKHHPLLSFEWDTKWV